jgi:hypothetical protein
MRLDLIMDTARTSDTGCAVGAALQPPSPPFIVPAVILGSSRESNGIRKKGEVARIAENNAKYVVS